MPGDEIAAVAALGVDVDVHDVDENDEDNDEDSIHLTSIWEDDMVEFLTL